jgi:NO-binding membrane sensor protein with MHYT domain
MHHRYEPMLVLLSVVIAIIASYAALILAGRVAAGSGRARIAWLLGGSIAMGLGIWSMHFIAMLAFSLPVPIAYDIALVLLSMVAGISASAVALFVVSRDKVRAGSIAAAGVAMCLAITGMHYIGMAAIQDASVIDWNYLTVAASAVIAVTASFAALWLFFRLRHDAPGRGWLRAGAAVVMGFAICGMHYTGMAAARFTPPTGALYVQRPGVLATNELTVVIVVAALVILGATLVGSTIDRRRTASSRSSSRPHSAAA